MRNTLVLALSFIMTIGCASKPKGGDSASFQVRPFETQKLENGLTVLWIPDQSLPYVSMQLMLKSGNSQDPVGKEGIASFTAAMLEKGTKKRSALKIADDLEQIGASFSTSTEPDYTLLAVSSLSFHRDQALEQFGEFVLTPSFPAAELERERKVLLGGLQKLADRPSGFAQYLLPRFLYGKHPYGHDAAGSPTSIRGFKRADLERFYKANYVPDNAVLAVVGQYDEAWKNKLVATFGAWKGNPASLKALPEFPTWQGTELLLVDRADLNQAQIQIGFKGVPRNIPEYMELRAALKVLGESFGSRLFEEIREKRGLTYHINAWFDPRLISGPMGIYTFTRIDKIGETVEQTLATYRQFVSGGVTDEEVATAKALMRGQFPRSFETPEALARQILLLNRYDIPVSYLTNYYATVDAMTKDSINATIKKYFDPSNLKILVYAPRGPTEATLRKLGKLEVKNYKEFLQ